MRLKSRALEVSLLNLHHQIIRVLSRNTRQRIYENNGKFHAFGLVDCQERHTAARGILGIIFVLCDSPIKEKP